MSRPNKCETIDDLRAAFDEIEFSVQDDRRFASQALMFIAEHLASEPERQHRTMVSAFVTPSPISAAGGDEDRACCAWCKHPFCAACDEADECCACCRMRPPRTVTERLAQHELIDIVPGVLSGVTPLIVGTRIGVHHILSYLYHGNSIEYIAENYRLTPEAVKDAIAFAQKVYDDAVNGALRSDSVGEEGK